MSFEPPAGDLLRDPTIEPDAKDWTWVLQRRCLECGLAVAEVEPSRLGAELRANAALWAQVLARPAVRERPRPDVWSPLEYAVHVRDVHRVFDERLAAMLETDLPRFPNWDQDEAAVVGRYSEQDPSTVASELAAAAEQVAGRYDGVPASAWSRKGLRGDGSEFTVAGLGRYHLHDVVHHIHDVADPGA